LRSLAQPARPELRLLANLTHRLHAGWFPTNLLGPSPSLYTMVFIISGSSSPSMLLYQAGAGRSRDRLREPPIDGAGRTEQFSRSRCHSRNTIVTSSTVIIIGSLTYFDVIWIITGGGPVFATRILPLDMYINAFQRTDLGYASAIATVLVAAALVLSLVLIRVTGFGRFRSTYEGA
jgi:raffinose/stachyose/melibiose transport system permease protein